MRHATFACAALFGCTVSGPSSLPTYKGGNGIIVAADGTISVDTGFAAPDAAKLGGRDASAYLTTAAATTSYLGTSGTAADATKLGGQLASSYLTTTAASSTYAKTADLQPVANKVNSNELRITTLETQRIERVSFSGDSTRQSMGPGCTGTCFIVAQSGGTSSVTRTALGRYTINFATPFSLKPSCWLTVDSNASGAFLFMNRDTSTTASVDISSYNTNQTALIDTSIHAFCIGPK